MFPPATSASIRDHFALCLEGSHATLTPNRQAILEHLSSALLPAPGLCALFGLPGVGKSALARALAHRWPGPATWIRALDLQLPDLLALIGDALAHAQLRPRDHAARLRLIHHAMRRQLSEGPRLLVLDQAELLCPEEAHQLLPLLAQPAIPATPGFRILLVAQGAFWLDWLPETLALIHTSACLNPLTPEEADLLLNAPAETGTPPHFTPLAAANLNTHAEGRPGTLLRLAIQSLSDPAPPHVTRLADPSARVETSPPTIPIAHARAG